MKLACYGLSVLITLFWAPAFATPPMDQMPKAGVYVNATGSPLLPFLANATGTIDIEIYSMKDATIRNMIREAIARGVRVRIIMEPKPVGESCKVFSHNPIQGPEAADCADEQQLVEDVRAAGGVFEPFNKKTLCPNGGGAGGTGCYQHGKMALADGVALISTGNFDASNLCLENDHPKNCDRDYTLIDDNPDVFNTLTHIFEADLKGEPYNIRALIPPALSNYLTVSPLSLKPIVHFINSATSSIELEAQYLKNQEMNNALIEAAKRGVKVSLTVASACSFGRPSASTIREITSVYSQFDEVGIDTKMFNSSNQIDGHPGYMHAKVIVIDGKVAWLGSENGSTESLTENREFGVIFNGDEFVTPILNTAQGDHSDAASETWQESLQCLKDYEGWNYRQPSQIRNL